MNKAGGCIGDGGSASIDGREGITDDWNGFVKQIPGI